MAFAGTLIITDQDVRQTQALTQLSGLNYGRSDTQLGAFGQTTDGRQYAFGLNNTTTAALGGNVQTGQAQIANHATRTIVTAQPAGANVILVTLGATAATQDQYQGGFLSIVGGTTPLIAMRIRSNTAAIASGITTVTLDEPLPLAITTSTVVSLMPHPNYLFAITSTTVANNNYVGVPNINVPASSYAWLQTNGLCQVLTDSSTFVKNGGVSGSATTAGAVTVEAATLVTQRLGYSVEAAASSSSGLINLQIV